MFIWRSIFRVPKLSAATLQGNEVRYRYLYTVIVHSHGHSYYRRRRMCVSKEKQTPFHLQIPFVNSSLQFPLRRTSDRHRGNKGLFPLYYRYCDASRIPRRAQGYQFRMQIFIGNDAKGITIAGRRQWGDGRTIEVRFGSHSVPQSSFPRQESISSRSCRLHNEATPTREM